MATLKRELKRKNVNGTYDSVYLKTSSELVIRPDGTTVETGLTALQSSSGGSGSSEATFDPGPVGSTVRIGDYDYIVVHRDINIAYVLLKYWYENVIFSINNCSTYFGSTIANKCADWFNNEVPADIQAACVETPDGYSKCFIPSADHAASIFDYLKASTTNLIFKNASGSAYDWRLSSLYGISSSNIYVYYINTTGTISGDRSANSHGFRPCLALRLPKVDLMSALKTAQIGDTVPIGSYEYLIVHKTSDRIYCLLKYWNSADNTAFGSNTVYKGSTIAAKCQTWFTNKVPADVQAICLDETVEGVTAKCFIPSKTQAETTFTYLKTSTTNRIFKDKSNNAYYWWLSSPDSSSLVWSVNTSGGFSNYGPTYTCGFRPCLALSLT